MSSFSHDTTVTRKVFTLLGISFFLGTAWFSIEQMVGPLPFDLQLGFSSTFLTTHNQSQLADFRTQHIENIPDIVLEQPKAEIQVRPTSMRDQFRRLQDLTGFDTKGSTISFYENFYASAAKDQCSDSDGGLNYAQKGTVTWKNKENIVTSLSDRALGEQELLEYYCEDGHVRAESITCPVPLKGVTCIQSSKEAMAKEFFYSADKEYLNTHILQLKQGWNWVSFSLMPNQKLVRDLFAPLYELDEDFIIKEQTGDLYWPKMDIDLLGEIDPMTSYQIYVSRPLEIEIPGKDFSYPIHKSLKKGWNFFGFHGFKPAPIKCVFKDLLERHLWAVKDVKGNVFASVNGEWKDGIEYLRPGQAYQVYVHNFDGDTLSFEFPETFDCE